MPGSRVTSALSWEVKCATSSIGSNGRRVGRFCLAAAKILDVAHASWIAIDEGIRQCTFGVNRKISVQAVESKVSALSVSHLVLMIWIPVGPCMTVDGFNSMLPALIDLWLYLILPFLLNSFVRNPIAVCLLLQNLPLGSLPHSAESSYPVRYNRIRSHIRLKTQPVSQRTMIRFPHTKPAPFHLAFPA